MEHRVRKRDLPLLLGFLVPGSLLMAVVIVVPLVLVMQYAMVDARGFVGPAEFVGLDNYGDVFADSAFWNALWRTVVYAVTTVVAQVALGIAIALVLHEKFPGNQLVRGVAVVPYIIPVVVVTIGWEWILDYDNGIANAILATVGLDRVQFLSVDLAMATSIALSVWAWTPFVTLVFLSGLQTVPDELHESAKVDGAGRLRRFFSITLPMLRGLIVTIVLLRGIWMFNKLDMIYLLTGGGPLQATETLPVLIYFKLFKMFDVGEGSAIAVITFVIMIVVMIVYLRLFEERDDAKALRGKRTKKGVGHAAR